MTVSCHTVKQLIKRDPSTHRVVAAIDHQLQDGPVVTVGVQGLQVIQGAADGSIHPLGELAGQVLCVLVLELSLEEVLEQLCWTERETHVSIRESVQGNRSRQRYSRVR